MINKLMVGVHQGYREFPGIGAVSIPGREFPGILKASSSSKIFVKTLTKYSKIRFIRLRNLYHKSLEMPFSSAYTRPT